MNSSEPTPLSPTPYGTDVGQFWLQSSYLELPERFYARVQPQPVASPQLLQLNVALARELGLDPQALASGEGVAVLAGNRAADGATPLALAYAGHQFGHFVPQLGDGRASLLGEVVGIDGVRYDVQLKGSGPTPFSRRGDGRAALGPVLREYLLSEAMAALGVPTTRALAALSTGESVYRDGQVPGAVLARVAASHLRIGTFEYFAAREDADGIRRLANYAIERHYPEVRLAKDSYTNLLLGVVKRQASLLAQWVLLGFIHGVMNTDNMSISGETIDYGPCAFMEAYAPDTVFSSIDRNGRYAYGNQPEIALWNLTRFAETLLPLLAEEHGGKEGAVRAATEVLTTFGPEYAGLYQRGMRQKLGLRSELEGDAGLVRDLLDRMLAQRVDYTQAMHLLGRSVLNAAEDARVRRLFADPAAFDTWAEQWRRRLAMEAGDAEERARLLHHAHPIYIPRNHQVEHVLKAAIARQDFAPFQELLGVLQHPFDERPGLQRFAEPATPEQAVRWTFCGT